MSVGHVRIVPPTGTPERDAALGLGLGSYPVQTAPLLTACLRQLWSRVTEAL